MIRGKNCIRVIRITTKAFELATLRIHQKYRFVIALLKGSHHTSQNLILAKLLLRP